jgi:hypothetical protein
MNQRALILGGRLAQDAARDMMLVRAMPVPKGYEIRNFECCRCDHAMILTVGDPMDSDAAGRLAGDLRPRE